MPDLTWNRAIESCLEEFAAHVWSKVETRNDQNVPIDLYDRCIPSVFAGLLGRQATLAIKISQCPPLWDGHITPMILRGMVECLVTFKWIALDASTRAAEYVGYGLGQSKLMLSHMQAEIAATEDDELKERLLAKARMQEAWIDSQILMPFVDVNLGSWAGTSIRNMCEEIGESDLYRFWFTPFSSAVHSTWQHVSVWNTAVCRNPLHMEHRVSAIAETGMDPEIVAKAAYFFDRLVEAFDGYYGLKLDEEATADRYRSGLLAAF